MLRIARFWDGLSRFGQPPSCKQPGMCSEHSGLRQAISELVQRSGKALLHGFEPRLESLALRLGLVECPRSVSVVLPWCSASPPILDEWSATLTLGLLPSSQAALRPPGPLRTGREGFPSPSSSPSNASLEETRFRNEKTLTMNPVMALGMK